MYTERHEIEMSADGEPNATCIKCGRVFWLPSEWFVVRNGECPGRSEEMQSIAKQGEGA